MIEGWEGLEADEIVARRELVEQAGRGMELTFEGLHSVESWMAVDAIVQDPNNVDQAVRRTHMALDELKRQIDLIAAEVEAGLL